MDFRKLSTPFAVEEGSYDGSHACHVSGQVPGPLPDGDERKDECGERLYPSARLELGLAQWNAPVDVTDKDGISFVVRSGAGAYPLTFSVAQTSTEMADPAYHDQFVSTCMCTEAAKALVPPEKRSCSAHYGVTLTIGPEWQLCVVYFTDLTAPVWGQGQGFAPSRVIKLLWSMQQPPEMNEITQKQP